MTNTFDENHEQERPEQVGSGSLEEFINEVQGQIAQAESPEAAVELATDAMGVAAAEIHRRLSESVLEYSASLELVEGETAEEQLDVDAEGEDFDLGDDIEIPDEEIEELLGTREAEVELPDLLERINRFSTVHAHKYDDESTVSMVLGEIEGKDDIGPEDEKVIADVEYVQQYIKFNSRLFTYVYTPEEVSALADKFRLLSKKNRPDFDGVEGEIVDALMGRIAHTDVSDIGVARRASQDVEGRNGMRWGPLNEKAGKASGTIRTMFGDSEDRQDYLLKIQDPDSDNKVDLTAVYQFVADLHANEVLLRRSAESERVNVEAFEKNVGIILSYMEEIEPLLEQIPEDLYLEISVGRKGQVRRYKPASHLRELVENMKARYENGDSVTTGIQKGYLVAPQGALNLQYRIAHTITGINKLLSGESDGEVTRLEDDGDVEMEVIRIREAS